MRYSRQRELILKTLQSDFTHPTADEIYAKVRVSAPDISLGTVYRNLNQLVDSGAIIRVTSTTGCDRFDAPKKPHYHIRCKKCGRVWDIPGKFTDELSAISRRIGACGLLAECLCEDCAAEDSPVNPA